MQDRVPTYPGRVKLTPVSGQADTYDLIRADQPTQQGTPLSKATLLSDGTEEAIWGDAANRTVDAALKELNSKNQGLAQQVEELAGQVGQIEEEVPNAGKIIFEDYYNADILEWKHETPERLSSGWYPAGASVGSYALFAGGRWSTSTENDAVDAYNASLTRSTPTELSEARYELAGASVGNFALFAGGATYSTASGERMLDTVDAYNSSLTRSTPTALSMKRFRFAGASVGGYALFAGGEEEIIGAGGLATSRRSDTVDAYNGSLTRSTPTALSQARERLAGASVGNYAVFAGGGEGANDFNTVDAYNASLTRTTPTELSVARSYLAGASVGNFALFAGGGDTVDAYNASLTRNTPTALSQSRLSPAGASIGSDYALFAGGKNNSSSQADPYAAVDAYDTSLTRSILPELDSADSGMASASVGSYALFGGGYYIMHDINAYSYDAYTTYSLDIPALSAYKFEGLQSSEEVTIEGTTLTGNGKLNGYIRRSGFTISGKH